MKVERERTTMHR